MGTNPDAAAEKVVINGMTQQEFDEKLGKAISSPVPTLMFLGLVAAVVLVAYLISGNG